MSMGQVYNMPGGGGPRAEAPDFVPNTNPYHYTSTQMQDDNLSCVDPRLLCAELNMSSAPPAATMHAPQTLPFATYELENDADGNIVPQPPPPPALTNVEALLFSSPSLPRVRSDVEAMHDRLARIEKRLDAIESRHNEVVAFCESFSSWSLNVLTYCEKLKRRVAALEASGQQTMGYTRETHQ